MEKFKKVLLVLLVIFIIFIFFVGIKIGKIISLAKANGITTEELKTIAILGLEVNTPFNSLTSHNKKLEKDIVNHIIDSSSIFYNPSEIKVLEVYNGGIMDPNRENFVNVKIQGKNALNGTVTKTYTIHFKDTDFGKAGTMEVSNHFMITDTYKNENVRIDKINKNLRKHWDKLGL